MKKNIFFLIVIVIVINGCKKMKNADLIIINAKIYTVNSTMAVYESMAIKDNKFVAIGKNDEVLSRFKADQVIDLKGKFVYPGFIDAHCHLYGYGLNLQKINLKNTQSFEEVLSILIKYHKEHPDLVWLIGRGWDQNLWKNKEFPDNKQLDKIFPDLPVLLERIDGHAALVNSVALKKAGITSKTNIKGGKIEIENGRMTGILIDNAIDLVNKIIPKPGMQEEIKALTDAEKNCLSVGLTTVSDAGLEPEVVDLIDLLQNQDKLQIRIYAMLDPTEGNINKFIKKGIYKTDKLDVRSIKLYADGSLGSRGACMLKLYNDKKQKGFILSPDSFYRKYCDLAIKYNYQINTHAIGDSANRYILNLYGSYLKGKNDKRWRIEHAQVINKQDFQLFGKYSVIPSVQTTHATSDMYWAGKRIGPERLKYAYAYKTLMVQNGWIANGSDFPVEDINPLFGFYAAVFRKDHEGYPPKGFQIENALSREQALKAMTIWAARADFEENEKGSIEQGKFADFVVLDTDIMNCKPEDIINAKVIMTYINGKSVFTIKID